MIPARARRRNRVEELLFAAAEPLLLPDEPTEAPVLEEPTPPPSRRIVVLSPKGGAGRTAVACNLAVALGRAEETDVGLVDLSLAFGDVACAMLLDPRLGLGRLAEEERPLATATVAGLLVDHPAGVHVLSGTENPAQAEAFSSDDVARVLEAVAAVTPTVVVDTAAGLDPATLTAVEWATDLVLVATLDVAAVLALRQALDLLDRLGMRAARRHVVLNRAGLRTGIDAADVESTLALPITAEIPDARAVATSMNEGHPVVSRLPRSAAARAFERLASTLAVPARA